MSGDWMRRNSAAFFMTGEHARGRYSEDEAWRAWYGLAKWKKRAKAHKHDNPLCIYCLRKGILNDGSKDMFGRPQRNPRRRYLVADHVERHGGDWIKFMTGELQSLCPDHHDLVEKSREMVGYSREIGADGFPVDATHPANRREGEGQSLKAPPPPPTPLHSHAENRKLGEKSPRLMGGEKGPPGR